MVWLDTAGLRRGGDELEAEGIRRTRQLMDSADAVLLVLDATTPAALSRARLIAGLANLRPACVALNKSDLIEVETDTRSALPTEWRPSAVPISAARRTGLEALTARLLESVAYDCEALEAPAAFTDRQVAALKAATEADRERFRAHLLRCLGQPRSA